MALTSLDTLWQIRLQSVTNVSADITMNTWATTQATGPVNYAQCAAAFADFYEALEDYFSASLTGSAGAHEIRAYSLGDPTPRLPVYSTTFQISPGNSSLPNEVAICTSFRALTMSGDVAARRRGRVFLGPLSQVASSLQSGFARPLPLFRDLVASSTESLARDLLDYNAELAVWSRADNELFPVVAGWVNNEFDTQRSRGPEATARSTWLL